MSKQFIAGLLGCLLVLVCSVPVHASAKFSYTLDPAGGGRMAIPLAYTVDHVIIDVGDPGFKKPSDLFIDENGLLYVADTENHRIVKLKADGEVLGVYGKEQGLELNMPGGVYVDSLGHMFVADTGNARIAHLSPEGELIEEFVKPDSSLISSTTQFAPDKVILDRRGYLYVLNKTDFNGFMMIDALNRFRGYIGANRVPFEWQRLVVRLLATPEQREQLNNAVPRQNSNITMDEKGFIYAPTVMSDEDQIKKFNAMGENIYKKKAYGENSISSGQLEIPYFIDLAVDQYGIINALDAMSRKIYQYDQEGNLLAVFGGQGNLKGGFEYPTSIAVDKSGHIYVLDRDRGNIQIFAPTRFAELIHEASQLHYNGRYQEALEPWREVLKIGENYPLAHRGVAKALMKEERWEEAMREFKLGGDQEGYSQAFAEYRHDLIREHLGWLLVGCVLLVYVIYLIVKRLRHITNSVIRRYGF